MNTDYAQCSSFGLCESKKKNSYYPKGEDLLSDDNPPYSVNISQGA